MFACSQCSKEFTSQGSLARHLQNHTQSARHVCHVCGVIFRRRDLLTRHMKLHGPESSAGRSSVADGVVDPASRPPPSVATGEMMDTAGAITAAASRKRCHTACNRCRDLKVKCDGRYPCSKCCAASKPCDFDRPTGRMSHMPAATTAATSDESGLSVAEDASMALTAFPPDVQSPAHDQDMSTETHPGDGDDRFLASTLPWDCDMSDITPWPWLHENIFLSGDPSSLLPFGGGFTGSDFTFPTTGDISPGVALAAALQDTAARHRDSPATSAAAGSAMGLTADSITAAFGAAATATPPCSAHRAPSAVPGPLSPPINDSDRARPDQPQADNPIVDKQRAVDEVVSLAAQAGHSLDRGLSVKSSELWARASSDLATAFGIKSDPALSGNSALLQHFVNLYKAHFHQLWPLLPRRSLSTGETHPLLYLVLASIGAMYMGSAGSECGTFLHNAVRRRVVLPVELDNADDNLIWLAQARLLTQVAALYFGQPRAFSYAQHLGVLLTAQARRMCLFSSTHHHQRISHFKRAKGQVPATERLDIWLAIEERRRLAFGIFRGDTFTSVLLNTKPLITLDEIGLEFPACNAVYNGEDMDARLSLEMIDHDHTPSRDLRASDVYYVLLERDEMLPPLEPIAHEILLFGLQVLVWRFSRDRQLLEGLNAGKGFQEDDDAVSSNQGGAEFDRPPKRRRRDTLTSEVESLDSRSYQMADLRAERQQLAAALNKWERALPLAKTFARTEVDRSYVLSSLILYHMSLLRLYAPVEDIHQIHYRLTDNQPVSPDLLASVRAWARSAEALTAAERARSVWSLIMQQTKLGRARSNFNFNAFVGLHHGAATMWAYNGARDHNVDSTSAGGGPQIAIGSSPTFSVHADKTDNDEILKTFKELFHLISPARWSSFADVTNTLISLDFPTS